MQITKELYVSIIRTKTRLHEISLELGPSKSTVMIFFHRKNHPNQSKNSERTKLLYNSKQVLSFELSNREGHKVSRIMVGL